MKQPPQKQTESQTQTSNDLSIRSLTEGVKIRELKDYVTLRQGLGYCWKLTGLKAIPTETELNILFDFIIGSYGNLCAPELVRAFKLGCEGMLKTDMNHYQNFSAEYLGRVLKAYSEYRAKSLSGKIKSIKAPEEEAYNVLDYYEKELFTKYDQILEKGKYHLFSEVDEKYLYGGLDRLGLEMATLEQKKEYMAEADSGLREKYRETDHERKKRAKEVAISLCFRGWIMGQIMEETDIRQLIKPLIKK